MLTPGESLELSARSRRTGRRRGAARGIDRRWVLVTAILIAIVALAWRASSFGGATVLVVAVALAAAYRPMTRPVPENILVLGDSPLAKVLAALLSEAPAAPRFRLRATGRKVCQRAPTFNEARALLTSTRCDRIVVADKPSRAVAPLLWDCATPPVDIVDGVHYLEGVLGRVPLEFLADEDWNDLRATDARDATYRTVKRILDVTLAIVVGVIVLPLLPLIALAIKLESRGPVLYHQERVGLDNRIFNIHKFRTMRADAERNGAVWAQVNDPRVTRLGRFLRRTRLDELPQIWNVLQGEMTLVGPRPERPQFTELLEKEIPGYQLRSLVRPGVTGWAQVRFRYTNSLHDSRMKLEYDLYYLKNASLLLDLRILFQTIFVVFGMRGV